MLNEIPGFTAALNKATAIDYAEMLEAWHVPTFDLCGWKVRTMTVEDYYALDLLNSPFVFGREPSLSEIAQFLWILSKPSHFRNIFGLRLFSAWLHGFRVKLEFGHSIKLTPEGLSIAESSEPFVIAAMDYIKKMFRDSPKGKTGKPSPICFIASWMDAMQSEYGMSTAEVWAMPLPQLFQRMNAIRLRVNPENPGNNQAESQLGCRVVAAMKAGTKREDLAKLFEN